MHTALHEYRSVRCIAERLRKRSANGNSGIQIIPYTESFKGQVATAAEEMHRNSIYRNMPLDRDKVVRQLAACGNIVPDRYFRIAVRGDRLLGAFYGKVQQAFFSDEWVASDMGWWVGQGSRFSAAAILLLADFEDWARSMGARKVMVGQSTGVDILRTTKLYNHCGYRIIGFNTTKDL